MIGIRQLADHLDISIGTVSRALNGRPDVNAETRKRVLEAAERLGYVANQSGRALRKGETGVIAFMMQTGPDITSQGDLFFMSVFDGVQTVLARHALDLVALLCSSQEDPDAYLKRVVRRGLADGFILSATRRVDPRFDLLAQHGIPFVALGRTLSNVGQPWIDLDFEGMAELAVDRLVAAGRRKIGVVWPHGDLNLGHVFVDRCRSVLAGHGLSLDETHVFRANPTVSGGYEVARRIGGRPRRPDGLVLVNDLLVSSLFRGLEEKGLRPGRDLGIIGLHSAQTRFLSPTLTGFDLSLRDLGIALAESLLATMPAYRAHYPDTPREYLWPMVLVDGESG